MIWKVSIWSVKCLDDLKSVRWFAKCLDDQENIHMILRICFSSYMHILQNIDDCDYGDNCVDDDDWDD